MGRPHPGLISVSPTENLTVTGVVTVNTSSVQPGRSFPPRWHRWLLFQPRLGRSRPTAGGFPRRVPSSITSGPDGNLWFTDPGNHAIGRLTTGGVVTEFTQGLPANTPNVITSGPTQPLVHPDWNRDIGRITPQGGSRVPDRQPKCPAGWDHDRPRRRPLVCRSHGGDRRPRRRGVPSPVSPSPPRRHPWGRTTSVHQSTPGRDGETPEVRRGQSAQPSLVYRTATSASSVTHEAYGAAGRLSTSHTTVQVIGSPTNPTASPEPVSPMSPGRRYRRLMATSVSPRSLRDPELCCLTSWGRRQQSLVQRQGASRWSRPPGTRPAISIMANRGDGDNERHVRASRSLVASPVLRLSGGRRPPLRPVRLVPGQRADHQSEHAGDGKYASDPLLVVARARAFRPS